MRPYVFLSGTLCQKTTRLLVNIFLLYSILFIPFPFHLFPFQTKISQFLFGDIILWILKGWGIVLKNPEISSDSLALYVLLLVLLLLSVFATFVLSLFKNWKNYSEKIFAIIRLILLGYLSMQLLKYGCHKLFKGQFYLPEPNILYTPLGQIDRDLLFWSTMGTSYGYNIFMGLLEIIPAIFLLFKKTRLVGLLIAIPVLINIVAINFSFDISVKVYSILLLVIALFLIYPKLSKLYDFFINQKSISLKSQDLLLLKKATHQKIVKAFIIGLIFMEALIPYILKGNFNDDKMPRPYLHGAYEIQTVLYQNKEVSKEGLDIKRFFIHRRGYIIFQNEKDEMQDFKLSIDSIKRQFILTNYDEKERLLTYTFNQEDSLLYLEYFKNGQPYELIAKSLDWQNLPLLQRDFHWYIEEIE